MFLAPRRRATSHLEQAPEKLDNEQAASARSTSDANQKPAPLRKSQSGVATLGRLRVAPAPQQGGSVVESPATPELERPRRRQPSAARSSRSGVRDQSLTQFAVIDDENVSQQVSYVYLCKNNKKKANFCKFFSYKNTVTSFTESNVK